jgi:hypothetical protein
MAGLYDLFRRIAELRPVDIFREEAIHYLYTTLRRLLWLIK